VWLRPMVPKFQIYSQCCLYFQDRTCTCDTLATSPTTIRSYNPTTELTSRIENRIKLLHFKRGINYWHNIPLRDWPSSVGTFSVFLNYGTVGGGSRIMVIKRQLHLRGRNSGAHRLYAVAKRNISAHDGTRTTVFR
jgi:hypothetical protein